MAYAIPADIPIDSLDEIESVHSPSKFINEINFNDIELIQVVGQGAFGVVQKARWNGKIVAIKIIEFNVKDFLDEVSSLSSVKHQYIIKLFGTTFNKPKLGLVMEYADCGSLYNLLHPPDANYPLVPYKFAHVMRWALQCAKAVNYLHQLKPRAIVHRDLKPPNMLLTEFGTTLKICDFGTATAQKTEMTSNKGSAIWMAPEVFEGSRYNEKCDVYSFGIVLWEMLTRKKPFDEIGPPIYRIMWAVHSGKRPPLIKNIPKGVEKLMTACWQKEHKYRPTFQKIVEFFEIIDKYVTGGDEPLFEFVDGDTVSEGDTGSYTDDDVITSVPSQDLEDSPGDDRYQSNDSNSQRLDPATFQRSFNLLRIASNSNNYLQQGGTRPVVGPNHHVAGGARPAVGNPHPVSGGNRPSPGNHQISGGNRPLPSLNHQISGGTRPTAAASHHVGGNPLVSPYVDPYVDPSVLLQAIPTVHERTPSDHEERPWYPNQRDNPAGATYGSFISDFPKLPPMPQQSPSPRSMYDPNYRAGHLGHSPGSVSSQHTSPIPDDQYNNRLVGASGGYGRPEVAPPHASGVDFSLVPHELMPVPPIEDLALSVQMYENHMQSLKTYIDLQNKIKEVRSQKDTIEKNIEEINKEQNRNSRYLEDYIRLQQDKSSLLDLHRSIKSILEKEKSKLPLPNLT